MIPHSSVLEAALFSFFWCFFTFCFQYCPAFFLQHFFPRLSVNLKTKICLNWLQRARRGFVSMVMRLLIGPEAQAANRPLLACRGLCLLVSLMNSFADGGWQGLIYQAGPEGWWGRRWLEQVKKKLQKESKFLRAVVVLVLWWVQVQKLCYHPGWSLDECLEWYVTSPQHYRSVPSVRKRPTFRCRLQSGASTLSQGTSRVSRKTPG